MGQSRARRGNGKGASARRRTGNRADAVTRDAQILDVGCGSGWATRLMAERAINGRVAGIDIADEMIQLAEHSSRALQNVEFKVASAEALPFKIPSSRMPSQWNRYTTIPTWSLRCGNTSSVRTQWGVRNCNRSVSRERTFA
jgi:SAM-dependent methyltransferase